MFVLYSLRNKFDVWIFETKIQRCIGYAQNWAVCASDTPWTRTHGGCVYDTVSDAPVWAGYGLVPGHVGEDAVHSLDTPEGRSPLLEHGGGGRGSLCKPLFHIKS